MLKASLGVPDPVRARYRTTLNEPMWFVVLKDQTLENALLNVTVEATDLTDLRSVVHTELEHLEQYDCPRYNLARGTTQKWIDARQSL